jgi:hypothetical protein
MLEMPISALNQAVEHGEKRQPKSNNCPQKPHGKPHFPVSITFTLYSGFHLRQTIHLTAYKVGAPKLYKLFHWHLKVK